MNNLVQTSTTMIPVYPNTTDIHKDSR